jgi:hypothetical protein
MYIQKIRSSIEAVRDMDSSTLTYRYVHKVLRTEVGRIPLHTYGHKWRNRNCVVRTTREGLETWGRILGLNWDKILKRSFPPCFSQSPVLTDFTPPPPPPDKTDLKLVCNVNVVYRNLKSEIAQDLCPETSTKLYVHEFGFCTECQVWTQHFNGTRWEPTMTLKYLKMNL